MLIFTYKMGLNEADTRAKLIDPALHGLGWTEDLIRRETTAGTIEIINGTPKRKKGRTDYLLCLPVKAGENPLAIAVLEAKKEDEHATLGLGQAKDYAKSLDVPFVFSTNGHLFIEYDSFDEKVSEELRLENFPKPELLKKLYEAGRGFSLEDEGAKPLCIPYGGGQSERRYYQDAAIRAALEKIAGKKDGGTCSMVIDEGVLFRTNELAFIQTKKKLLEECDLWCIISLPQNAFLNAGAGVKTNLYEFVLVRC